MPTESKDSPDSKVSGKSGPRMDMETMARSAPASVRHKETIEQKLARTTHLTLNDKGLRMIENIELCKNLRQLYLYDNKIERIDGLGTARGLTHLYLQNNFIREIEGLDTLQQLTKLFLDGNQITSIKGIEGCSRLEELYISNQQTGGKELVLHEDVLRCVPYLRIMTCSNNNITTIEPLACLQYLEKLDASKNKVSDMADVVSLFKGAMGLQSLDLRHNPLARETKYRDKVIMLSPKAFTSLDGKAVDMKQREFLLRREMNKRGMLKKPSRGRGMGRGGRLGGPSRDDSGMRTVSVPVPGGRPMPSEGYSRPAPRGLARGPSLSDMGLRAGGGGGAEGLSVMGRR